MPRPPVQRPLLGGVDVPASDAVAFAGLSGCWRSGSEGGVGVWPQLHEVLPAELRSAGLLDMDDAAIDGSHVRALKGGSHRTFAGRPGPARQQAPPDRRLAQNTAGLSLTSGNRHDVTQLTPLLDAIPRTRGVRGRPRHRPGRLFADRGYDYDKYRPRLRAAPVQTASNPLRDTRRPPPRAAPTRMRCHLLETAPNLNLQRSVRCVDWVSRMVVGKLSGRWWATWW